MTHQQKEHIRIAFEIALDALDQQIRKLSDEKQFGIIRPLAALRQQLKAHHQTLYPEDYEE